MDLIIRQHLSVAETRQAANGDRSTKDAPEMFGSELYVLCAEQALQLGNSAVSKDCLQMYFSSKPPPNQFYGRAYLCKAQLDTPLNASDVDKLEKSVAYYLKSIEFAKKQPRYHFLVYNASVLFWQTVRPFLKPGSRHRLVNSLTAVVKSLGEIDDADKEWRADLMLELLNCLLDAQKMKEATECASMAGEFIKANVPHKCPLLFSKMVHHKLIDSAKAAKETKSSASLSIIYKVQKLRSQMDSSLTSKDIFTSLNEIYNLLTGAEEPALPLPTSERIPLLIELARLSLELRCNQLVVACLNDLKSANITDQRTLLTMECLQSELEVLSLGPRIDMYTKTTVEIQLKIIKRMETPLQDAVRLGDPVSVQDVCVTLWNLCLPLLQHNLRKHVKKSLVSVSEALEGIDSLLTVMRCQIHIEIAQIEEQEDRIEVAIEHVLKAVNLDGNGQYQNFLKMYLHRLQLRATLYTKPQRAEDQAAMILEQAKQSNSKDSVRKKRPLLVNVGLCLAPDAFQMVLESENESKVSTGKGYKGQISHLCLIAQHHTKCVFKTEGHLTRTGNKNDVERVKLWADLAKVARKQEVWDVCRTACRFCLLYDDGRWSTYTPAASPKTKSMASTTEEGNGQELESAKPATTEQFSDEKSLLRMLAEVRFINAEATIHLLKSLGCKLNVSPIPSEDTSMRPSSYVAVNLEEDPEWIVYKDWVSDLSAYTMDNFLHAVDRGIELQEAWITHNAAVYILNHNKHIIASGNLSVLVEPLKKLLVALKKTGHHGNPVLLAVLSNTLAKGLIHPWIPVSHSHQGPDTSLHADKKKRASGKGPEKPNAAHVLSIDPNGLADAKLALEVCEFALELTNGSAPEDVVPISVRQQLLSTWVKVKQMLQQQIGQKLGTNDEENNEDQNLMTKVLVALEMHACNGLGLMEFNVPILSQVLKMTLDCHWSDPLVEVQTLTRLAHFAYSARDLELALTCAQTPLKSDGKPTIAHVAKLECEMLSTAACIQGQSIMENLAGKKHLRLSAIKAFEASARFGGEAGSRSLALQAAKHFWHACFPLTKSAKEREPLKDSVTAVIRALNEAETNLKQESENDTTSFHLWPTMDIENRKVHDPSNPKDTSSQSEGAIKELILKTGLYELLFTLYADKNDWDSGLKVLDEAINILPRTRHRLVLFKHRVLVKARLGQNFFMDIQKFKDESEDYVSYIWHLVAQICSSTREQLACYLNAIDALKKPENEWQKVEYLLELAEWLYCKQFPLGDAMSLLDWAVDILLHMKFTSHHEEGGKSPKVKGKPRKKSSQNKEAANEEDPNSQEEHPVSPGTSLEDLKNIRQLEALARAHTLMANLSGPGSPAHEQNCLMAYAYITRIWQVSLPAAASFVKSIQKYPVPAQNPPSASSRKDKGKKEPSEPVLVKEKPKRKGAIDSLPSNVEEWAGFDCPDELRDAFKQDTSSQVINRSTIVKPTYTLHYLELLVEELQRISYTHLTFPVLNLAEVIAHDVVESKSLADLYNLKMAQINGDLKLYNAASYHQKTASNIYINEYELLSCRQETAMAKNEKHQDHTFTKHMTCQPLSGRIKLLSVHADGKGLSGLSLPYLWLQKAEVLIQLGYFQPAGVLLSQAYKSLQDIGEKHGLLKCLYLLSMLANCEKNHGQAISILLETKDLERDAELLYGTTLTLTEAVMGEEKEGRERKACQILNATINAFEAMAQREKNRAAEYGYLIAKLNARKFAIILENADVMIRNGVASSQTVVTLLDICDKMSQIEADLLRLGYREYRADLLMEHSSILRLLASTAENEERKHSLLVDAYAMAEQAISILEQIQYNIQSTSLIEAGGISLPVTRKLAKMKLSFAELCLEIIQLVIHEESEKVEEEKCKGALRVMVEEFVRATPDYNSIEQEWKTLSQTVSSTALSQLASALALAGGCSDLKAQCLYLTGKCLLLQSFRVDPLDPNMYWNKPCLDKRENAATIGDSDAEQPDADTQPTNKQTDQLLKKAVALKTRRTLAEVYLAQSTELLLQAINVAIENNLRDTLSAASLEICSCFGQFDPLTAASFLALHQSCSSSKIAEDLVLTATRNTSSSQFAALLHLQQYLKSKGDEGPLRKQVEQKLATISRVWGNLQITMQHFSIFNELPPNFTIIILQHSEDGSFLYGALLEKAKVISTQKGKLHQQQRATQAKVARCAVDRQMFSCLQEKMELFKQDTMQKILKLEHQQMLTKQKNVFEKINKNPAMDDSYNQEEEGINTNRTQFQAIVQALEDYLNPVLLELELSPPRLASPPLSTTESMRAKSREKEEKPATASSTSEEVGDCIVVLADRWLEQLPLEALAVFKDESVSSVSRDFSLQFLYNRIHRVQTEGEGKRDVKSAKESKQKKNIKTVPVNRVLPAHCMPVETHRFRYIVDPYNDIKEPESSCPAYRMNEMLVKYGQQFTAYWEGIIGSTRAPSHADWENLMTDCSAFIFYGTEKLLAHIMLDKVLAMDLSECQLMILIDLVRTSHSFSRQSTIDVQKSKSLLSLERPVETALLLSVVGVHSVMLNQWHTTAEQNAGTLDCLTDYLLYLGKTTGQTVHSQRKFKSDSEVTGNEGDVSEEADGKLSSPRNFLLSAGDPCSYIYALYGLPNMVVM
ncbi:cilia- and flagella-associated protein 46 isoform X2 [Hyperolius riggenbachi]|uniref:cilia- and flagella-associated protein 46 isoform X2 n=1 Tax=Hyperolius riggenbachi TaxID=752182 RepID=UPI0035A2A305